MFNFIKSALGYSTETSATSTSSASTHEGFSLSSLADVSPAPQFQLNAVNNIGIKFYYQVQRNWTVKEFKQELLKKGFIPDSSVQIMGGFNKTVVGDKEAAMRLYMIHMELNCPPGIKNITEDNVVFTTREDNTSPLDDDEILGDHFDEDSTALVYSANYLSPGKMEISVKTLTNKTFNFLVDPNETVHVLKRRIQEAEGILPVHQRILIYGKVLEDFDTLTRSKVQHGNLLHMIIRMRGTAGSDEAEEEPERSVEFFIVDPRKVRRTVKASSTTTPRQLKKMVIQALFAEKQKETTVTKSKLQNMSKEELVQYALLLKKQNKEATTQ